MAVSEKLGFLSPGVKNRIGGVQNLAPGSEIASVAMTQGVPRCASPAIWDTDRQANLQKNQDLTFY